jgi:hypothetical protein
VFPGRVLQAFLCLEVMRNQERTIRNSNRNYLNLILLLLLNEILVFVSRMTLVSTSGSGQEQSVLHGFKNETMLWESPSLELLPGDSSRARDDFDWRGHEFRLNGVVWSAESKQPPRLRGLVLS